MARKIVCAFGSLTPLAVLLLNLCNLATAQSVARPLDPNDRRLIFSFPIQPGGKSFRFKVELDKAGTVIGFSAFRGNDSTPFQTLQTCGGTDLLGPVTDAWADYEIAKLMAHADLNFDGFEDVELLQYYNGHLDKNLYCIYLWDHDTGRFILSKELTDLGANPVPDPSNKTISVHNDWQGGAFEESTYRWNGGKLELIEQRGLYGDWSMQAPGKCGFEFSCGRLVDGEMVDTLVKPICTVEEMQSLPSCPDTAVPSVSMAPKQGETVVGSSPKASSRTPSAGSR